MESDLISRSALLAEYDRIHVGKAGGARKLIAEAPAVDAVAVVRCKDCIYYKPGMYFGDMQFCFRLKGADGETHVGYNFSPDDFCSRGVKKDAVD